MYIYLRIISLNCQYQFLFGIRTSVEFCKIRLCFFHPHTFFFHMSYIINFYFCISISFCQRQVNQNSNYKSFFWICLGCILDALQILVKSTLRHVCNSMTYINHQNLQCVFKNKIQLSANIILKLKQNIYLSK